MRWLAVSPDAAAGSVSAELGEGALTPVSPQSPGAGLFHLKIRRAGLTEVVQRIDRPQIQAIGARAKRSDGQFQPQRDYGISRLSFGCPVSDMNFDRSGLTLHNNHFVSDFRGIRVF